MIGDIQWLQWKSNATKEREDKEYEEWAFPYGEAHREKIESLLAEYFPHEEKSMSLISFLTCKELFDRASNGGKYEESGVKALKKGCKKYKTFIRKKDAPMYSALAVADVKIDEKLEYPSAEELKMWAEHFESLPDERESLIESIKIVLGKK